MQKELGPACKESLKTSVTVTAAKLDETGQVARHQSVASDPSANAVRRGSSTISSDKIHRRHTTGNITAEVVGRCESEAKACTEFTIVVRNGWSVLSLKRRYREFAALDQELRPTMSSLPDLPPKGFLKKFSSALLNDPSFMNDRERGLGKVLEAMISLDPSLKNFALRDFLGMSQAICTFDGR
jgi:hypothetical protein